ncbi:MAG: choice-of-anchor L domain-containing protein [Myxococcales bacterium]|nr:choice-of-anchor L domain-containing protein [Polyangiaceae bacterium]MDW8249061.1 choice-of-anchor L domain-containing protein [Myxococcales bacterium]
MYTLSLVRASSLWLVVSLGVGGLVACGGTGGSEANLSGAAGKVGRGGKGGASDKGGSDGGVAGESGQEGGANPGGSSGFPGGAGGSPAGSGGSSSGSGGSTAGLGGSDAAGSGGSNAGSGGTSAGSGGTSAGSGGTSAGSGGSEAGVGGTGGSFAGSGGSDAGSGGGGQPFCAGDSNIDNDGDGFTEADGDCNDCDPNANPGAIDIITYNPDGTPADVQADEDCDGSPTLPGQDTCDQNLAIDSNEALHGAFAMDICKVAQGNSWGILKAEYVTIDNQPLSPNGHLGHGLLTKFGSGTFPQRGASMFVISSGTARAPGDPDYASPGGFTQGSQASHPPGFPLESPSCPGVKTGNPYDSVALRLTLRAPTNAKSFSFKFRFFTYEYPKYICSQFNDFFAVLMDPPPPDVNQLNKNITFDSQKNPVSVNNAFLEVCTPGTHKGKFFPCPSGTGDLQGTGFETGGATVWLQTQANVAPGSTFTLTFTAYDSGDPVLDSTGIVDDFRWSAEPAQGGTSTGKP